jgi:hypothetical protein
MIIDGDNNRSYLSVEVLAHYFVFPILMFVPRIAFKRSPLTYVYDIIERYVSKSGPLFCMLGGKYKGTPE